MQAIRQFRFTLITNFVNKLQHQPLRWTSSSQPSEFITTNLENGIGRYVCQLQRITFKFCKESPTCRGIREFIENDLIEFAEKNPGVVVYLEPKRHRKAKIHAEYLNGSKQTLDVHQYTRERINKWLEFMRTRKGDVLVRLLKKQQTHYPSIQGVWNPFTNKEASHAVESYPSEKYKTPLTVEKTATEQILELAKNSK